MAAIAPTDEDTALAGVWRHVFEASAAHAEHLAAHPSRTVILLPFVQLLPTAREWAMRSDVFKGFLPRFETVQSWARRLSSHEPAGIDLRFDVALDSLRARDWLARAGLADKQALLTGALVQAAHQLGMVVAAIAPEERAAWATDKRASLMVGLEASLGVLGYEQAVSRIALEWAAASSYVTDALWSDALRADADALVLVRGIGRDALAENLCARHGPISVVMDEALTLPARASHLQALELDAGWDEVDAALACVMGHVNAGRQIALAAEDRLLTRQISSALVQQGLAVNDETGWRLDTTRAAALLMSLLRAARWDASQAERMDWLRQTNAPRAQVDALERQWRLAGMAPGMASAMASNPASFDEKPGFARMESAQSAIEFIVIDGAVEWQTLLNQLRRARPLRAWLADVKAALQAAGQWAALQADEAGRVVLLALHFDGGLAGELDGGDASLSLAEFSRWVQDALQADSYKPSLGTDLSQAQVTILPLAQVMARPFDVLVIAGADEERLPQAPEPTGWWTAAQRELLGLPSRAQMAAERQVAWQRALGTPRVELIWARSDGERERVMSPLLARSLMQAGVTLDAIRMSDPRETVSVQALPTPQPQPVMTGLASQELLARTERITQSDYQALRTCPYRYYALRLLGLRELDALDAQISKRDFGSWIHDVLRQFHEQRRAGQDAITHAQQLDDIAAESRLQGEGFIPFDAAWPQVREGYLKWLAKHEAQGIVFSAAEQKLVRPVEETIRLEGRVDRIDCAAEGLMVIDYKTENDSRTRERVRDPLEDTQLAFYAALHDEASSAGLRAAYLNIGEKATVLVEQTEVGAAREALIEGVRADITRVRGGAALRALGEGAACEHCAARGLCRKDFWA
jgi:ATP-dependent helicase/nuclease subunit B